MQERRGGRRSAALASPTTAMVVANDQAYLPARLSWRGIEVTEEFQEYAMRVSRGEQLEPFRGQVLARPCPEFPWSEPANEQEHTSTESLPRFRSRGPRVAAWLFGIGALLMAGLGIGSGTAHPDAGLDPFVLPPTTTALALRPASRELDPTSHLADLGIASAIETALAHAVPAEGDTARAASSAGLGQPARSAPARPARSSAPLAAGSALAATVATPLTPGPRPAPASEPGTSMSASLASSGTGGGSVASAPTASSTLFSDSPSF